MRTSHLTLGWTILLLLAAAPMAAAAAADDCAPAALVAGVGTGLEAALHRHLTELDRQLLRSLTEVAADPGPLDTARLQDDVEGFRGALRDLERQARALAEPAATNLVRKARRLDGLLHNLERTAAGADPAGALPAGGGWPGEVLRVPPAPLAPANDDCAAAFDLSPGQTAAGDTSDATQDGQASCGASLFSNDVWFKVTAAETAVLYADTFGSGFDTVLSVHHGGCPGTLDNQLRCNDDAFGLASAVSFQAYAGQEYWLRLSGYDQAAGSYLLRLGFGGEVAGKVTSAHDGDPLAGGDVRLWNSDGYHAGTAETGPGGQFSLATLEAGGYYLSTRYFDGFFDELYDDLPCPGGGCEVTDGTAVEVTSHGTVEGIDFALVEGGAVAGTVTEAATGAPVAELLIEIWDQAGQYRVAQAVTDEHGDYRADGLAAGTYFATTDTHLYADELYDDIPCDDLSWDCDPETGTPIAVAEAETTAGIDFALDRLGMITGTVTDTLSGEPIPWQQVRIRRQSGAYVGSTYSDLSGEYQIGGLSPDTYVAYTDTYDYLDELYDDIPCPGGFPGSCDPADGTPIPIELNATAEGVDFALDHLGAIAGTVTDAATGEPIAGVRMDVHAGGGWEARAYTNGDGEYLVDGLEPQSYLVGAETEAFVDQLYEDVPCPGGLPYGCDPEDGTAVPVEVNATRSGIDFALERLGSIAGTVVDAATGEPRQGIEVIVWDAAGTWVDNDATDLDGHYALAGLDTGSYFVTTRDEIYLDQLYDDLPCFDGCDPTAGTPIGVTRGATAGGVDFALDRGGAIAGTVIDAATGEPIQVWVGVWAADGSHVDNDWSDHTGQFAIEGLTPGTYFAAAERYPDYLRELYGGSYCPPGCDPTAGTPIAISAAATADIDFALDRPGEIAGMVVDALSGLPMDNARVRVWDAAGVQLGSDWVAGGHYSFYGVYPGTYFVTAHHSDYVEEVYDGLHCPRTGCQPTTGTPVTVDAGTTHGAIDFALEPLGAISSTVVDAATGEPLQGMWVEIWTDGDGFYRGCSTDETGTCIVGGLYPGTYYAVTDNSSEYLDELYDNLPCLWGPLVGCDPTKGTPIPLAAAATEGIAFALMLFDSGIAGRVSAEGVTPLDGVTVDVWDQTGGHVASTTSLVTGEYYLRLDPGTYTVSSDNDAGYDDQIYPGVPCPRGSAADGRCDPLVGVPITVENAGPQMIVTGIDFELAPAGALIFGDGFESGDLSAWE